MRTLWHVAAALGTVPVIIAAVAIGWALNLRGAPVAVAVVLLAVTAAAAGPGMRYRRWKYALGEDELEIRRGVFWTTVTVIPYARLQFVDTKQGPLDRLFGLASLVVHTAAPGTAGTLPGLAVETAAVLRQRLAEVDPEHDDASV